MKLLEGKVSLIGLEFFAYHGYYNEEQKIGNKYVVNLTVHADLSMPSSSDQLNETINYEVLYALVKECMLEKSRLLEHVAFRIGKAVFSRFQSVQTIQLSVSKLNPPIGGISERAEVELTLQRED
jgi:dihydroneopterin aldolase